MDTPARRTGPAPAPVALRQFIGGIWRDGRGSAFRRGNPARPQETVALGLAGTAEDVGDAVQAAVAAAADWSATPAHERGAVLQRASRIVADHADEWGAELAREEGKTLAEGIGEVRRAAQILDYAGHEADRAIGSVYNLPRVGERIIVVRRPLGVVGLITPFNFPVAIPAWKIAPALASGNAIVWKPAGPVPLLALRLATALDDADLPGGVLNLVFGEGVVGAAIVEHPGVDGVSFTGSTAVGRVIAAAGAQRGIPVQAEFGGKNAAIVLADADLELAAGQVLAGAFNSSGQKCTATSRLVVADAVAGEFGRLIAERADALTVGDPLDTRSRLGPVVTAAAKTSILAGVRSALDAGARPLTAREPDLGGDGHFVLPQLLDVTGRADELWEHELFGPVLAMRTASSVDEAFAEATAGQYGLSAAVFTNNLDLALHAVDLMPVGQLHVNSETAGADPHVPFGGGRASGLGPKEQGEAAREFYSTTTTVYLRGGA